MKKLSFKNLDKDYRNLIVFAKKAIKHSYSPYSSLAIGAGILTKSGKIFLGTNIENASYGLTICAERVAIFSAISNGEKDFKALAITSNQKNITPCGACRQVFFEVYEAFGNDFKVLVANSSKEEVLIYSVSELLPNPFSSKDLK